MKTVVLIVFASVAAAQTHAPDAEQFVGPPQGVPMQGPALDQTTHDVAVLLRCPVCQGLSIADSTSEMAYDMRGQVRQLLARGFSQRQILDYFERSYGQFVLLKPKFRGLTMLVWMLPLFVLATGIFVVVMKTGRLGVPAVAPPPLPEDDYVARVRDLVKQ